MISLILGGGVGSRLYPLTGHRSKPAVPIGGKYRLIDIPISNCLNSGLRRMFVVTQFNSASLNQHIKNTYHFDQFTHGFVDILAAEQTPENKDWFQGTADAVRQSMHHMNNQDYDYVLILSGDQLYQMDFEQMAKFHVAKGADITIATIPCDAKDASDFGIMKVDKNSNIEKFIEKPKADILHEWTSPVPKALEKKGKKYLASMGIYIFSKEVLMELFAKHSSAVDFGKEIIPAAITEGKKIVSYQYDGYWTDIGTIGSFYEANLEMCDPLPQFNLFDNVNIVYTRSRQLPSSKINGTKLVRAVVADGSIINAKLVQRSIVGIRSRLGKGTTIKDSILMGNDRFQTLMEMAKQKTAIPMGIGDNCFIERAIVDKNCKIGDNVIIRGHESLKDVKEELYCIVDGIVVLKKGVTIADGTVIGYSEK
jgi:glucose-1-phosphate adenylyltransferase